LSGIVPLSVALWKTTCGGRPPDVAVARAMLIRDGLRVPSGRERMRSRRALPRVHAVLAVKVVKVCSGLTSWAMRAWGCGVVRIVHGSVGGRRGEGLTLVLGAERAIVKVILSVRIEIEQYVEEKSESEY
jgi:hypothetical protein